MPRAAHSLGAAGRGPSRRRHAEERRDGFGLAVSHASRMRMQHVSPSCVGRVQVALFGPHESIACCTSGRADSGGATAPANMGDHVRRAARAAACEPQTHRAHQTRLPQAATHRTLARKYSVKGCLVVLGWLLGA